MANSNRQPNAERFLHLAASVVTLLNFVFSMQAAVPTLRVSILQFPALQFPLRLGLFLLLVAATSQATSRLGLRLLRAGPGMSRIYLVIVCAASAWTSLFNAKWIFLGSRAAPVLNLIVFVMLCWAINAYFIVVNTDRYARHGYDPDGPRGILLAWQTAAFMVMYLAFLGAF